MTTKSSPSSIPGEAINEHDVRDYAYHLYIQSGCIPSRETDNWLEAKACLFACIQKSESHTRLHQRIQKARPTPSVNEDEIHDYAYHLYVQNGHRNDQCADNWQEARACLEACIPKSESHIRLHRHLQTEKKQAATEGQKLNNLVY
jgi:DTW domain-containing protein YfiP